ncbi:MAG TPA: hypothetical protein ENK56_10060, partial [Chloroflexi bacterium]|nr:hypothetical protein [Chloroflexota bacterium]
AKERARVVEEMLPLLRDVADPVEREAYAQKIARALHIEDRTVLLRLREAERRAARRARPTPGPAPRREPARADLEGYCLTMLLTHDHLLEQINQVLEGMDLPPLHAQDFTDPAYRALFESWEKDGFGPVPDFEWLRAQFPAGVVDRLEALLPVEQELAEERWLREGVHAALRLRERNLRRMGAELRMLIQEAAEANLPEVIDYGQALEENARAILQVQQALRARRWEGVKLPTTVEGFGGEVV